MRHRKQKITLSRTAGERKALARKMAISLFLHGKIQTTAPRARFVRRFAEPLITKAKPGTITARRAIAAALGNRVVVDRVLKRAKQYEHRAGGYTRVTRLTKKRRGDGAPLVQVEFV